MPPDGPSSPPCPAVSRAPGLSVCFLTRNEEGTIGRAVRSVLPVAGQVLVVDTGSADRTAEVAARAGATVASFTWTDDFAAGRNYALRHATGEWVLWMNGTEELLAEGAGRVGALLSDESAFGYFVRVRHVPDAGRPDVFTETEDLRLFRRRPVFGGNNPSDGGSDPFVGRLHPHFRPGVVEAVRRGGLRVSPSDVVIVAAPETGAPTVAKLRFNARLLELELHERPGQLHYLIEYGRMLLTLAEMEGASSDDEATAKGREALAQAAAMVWPLRDAPSPPSQKVQVLLNFLLSAPPALLPPDNPIDFDAARELALRWFPDSPNLLWTVAEQSFKRKDYAGAADVLRRLLDLGRTGRYDRSHRFDPRILGSDALMNLGACLMQMKQLDAAEACFVQLATDPTWGPQANQHLTTIQKWRRGR